MDGLRYTVVAVTYFARGQCMIASATAITAMEISRKSTGNCPRLKTAIARRSTAASIAGICTRQPLKSQSASAISTAPNTIRSVSSGITPRVNAGKYPIHEKGSKYAAMGGYRSENASPTRRSQSITRPLCIMSLFYCHAAKRARIQVIVISPAPRFIERKRVITFPARTLVKSGTIRIRTVLIERRATIHRVCRVHC